MSEPGRAYRVLARKYRPSTFAELIGQEAMVRTLTNAIATGRIAHAFILTGVRGVGKTTTARIIARALNCVGPDGKGGPTAAPCGVCEPCRAIAEDRYVDVMEIDAASRAGVDEIRELTDGVRYKPVAARFKIYIIDEVHMLSKAAFNALLKTLEEPPRGREVHLRHHRDPQSAGDGAVALPALLVAPRAAGHPRLALRQDLPRPRRSLPIRRALALIARAADGSVRDGLSILDQAMALSGETITEGAVREMLGIADRGLVFDLLEAALKGDAPAALAQMKALYEGGADPLIVLQDLLDLTHFLTRLKLAPNAGEGDPAMEGDRARGAALAAKLGIPSLARAWQLLLKGIGEAQESPSSIQAAEMVLVRLAYVADLPSPAELIRTLEVSSAPGSPAPRAGPARVPSNTGASAIAGVALRAEPHALSPAQPQSFLEAVELFEQHSEALLRAHLYAHVHLVHFEAGRIELRPEEAAPRDLPNRLGQLLTQWTGQRWVVSVSGEPGDPTLKEQAEARAQSLKSEAAREPLVRAVLDAFPGARIETVRETVDSEAAPAPEPEELAEGDEFS